MGLRQDLLHAPPLCIPALNLPMSQSSGLGNSDAMQFCSQFLMLEQCWRVWGVIWGDEGEDVTLTAVGQGLSEHFAAALSPRCTGEVVDRQTGLAHFTSLPCSCMGLGRQSRSFKEMQEMFCFLCTAALFQLDSDCEM